MKNKEAYSGLIREIEGIEVRTGLYLCDENVDRENVSVPDDGSETFWSAMICAAEMAAGQRAEAAGYDINKLIGRVIY